MNLRSDFSWNRPTECSICGKIYPITNAGDIEITAEDYPHIHSKDLPNEGSVILEGSNSLLRKINSELAEVSSSISLPFSPDCFERDFLDCNYKAISCAIASNPGLSQLDVVKSNDEFYFQFSKIVSATTLDKIAEDAKKELDEIASSADAFITKAGFAIKDELKKAEKRAKAKGKQISRKIKVNNRSYDLHCEVVSLDLEEAAAFPFAKYDGTYPLFISKYRDGQAVGEPLFKVWKLSNSHAKVEIMLEPEQIQSVKMATSFENLFLKGFVKYLFTIPTFQLHEYNLEPGSESICFSLVIEGNDLSTIINQALTILN